MEMQIRRRMKALDGTTFRFERKNGQLFLNGGLLHVRLLKGSIVELVTEYKCVQVSGADYWEGL